MNRKTKMGNLSDYFGRTAYKPKYYIGDRVFGHWNKIPFIGTVGNDTVISLEEGPRITIQLDLPILLTGRLHYVIIVKHKDVKPLKEY